MSIYTGHTQRGPWDKLAEAYDDKVVVYRYERTSHFGGQCPVCAGQVASMRIELCWWEADDWGSAVDYDREARLTAPTYRVVMLGPCGHLFRGENVTLKFVSPPPGRVINPKLLADLGGDPAWTEAILARYQGREWADPAELQ